MRTTKTLHWLVALSLLLSVAQLDAQEKAKKKKAESKPAAGAPANPATVETPAAAPGGQIVIPWDRDTKLVGRPQIVKRLYRLKKSGQWEQNRLPHLIELCLATGDRILKMYATWYQSLVAGHEGNGALAAQKLKEAIDLGYLNVVEMQGAEELAVARESQEIKDLIASLEKTLRERMVKNFQAGVDANFAAAKASPPKPWKPDLKALDGAPVFVAGRPSVIALARIHEDSFEQFVPRMQKIAEKAPVSVLFWQYDSKEPARLEQTQNYVTRLAGPPYRFSSPAAVVGRAEYIELRAIAKQDFARAASVKERSEDEDEEVFREAMPFTIFFDGTGAPVESTVGVLDDWQVDYIVQKFLELAPQPPPTPPPVEKPAAPAEEKPAVKPEGPKPEPTPAAPSPPPAEEKKSAPEPGKPADAEKKDAPPPEKPADKPVEPEKKPAPKPAEPEKKADPKPDAQPPEKSSQPPDKPQ